MELVQVLFRLNVKLRVVYLFQLLSFRLLFVLHVGGVLFNIIWVYWPSFNEPFWDDFVATDEFVFQLNQTDLLWLVYFARAKCLCYLLRIIYINCIHVAIAWANSEYPHQLTLIVVAF